MLFSFLPSLPVGIFKATTIVVVATALSHQLYYSIRYHQSMSASHSYTSQQPHYSRDFFPSQERVPGVVSLEDDQGTAAEDSFFGACLMVRDDNELLYEWLAYHYTVLRLRYVVVGMDINSTQDPRHVLQRWTNDTGLRHWVLNAPEFSSRHLHENSKQEWMGRGDDKDGHHHALISRQKGFLTTCSQLLKKQGVRWTAYLDSDEFVVPNVLPESDKNLTLDGNGQNSIRADAFRIRSQLRPVADSWNATTLADVLFDMQRQGAVDSCYTMPRLIVGALENRTCPGQDYPNHLSRYNFTKSNMSTFRFVQHAKKGDFQHNKFGKVFMDLSRISDDALAQEPRNIHRPFREHCGPGVVHFPDAVFYIAHYIGSWERYSSRRGDGRRNRHEWEQRASFDDGLVCETGVHRWLSRFVAIMGEDRATALLGGAPSENAVGLISR